MSWRELWNEFRLLVVYMVLHLVLCIVPKNAEGLRLAIAIRDHITSEQRRLAVQRWREARRKIVVKQEEQGQ